MHGEVRCFRLRRGNARLGMAVMARIVKAWSGWLVPLGNGWERFVMAGEVGLVWSGQSLVGHRWAWYCRQVKARCVTERRGRNGELRQVRQCMASPVAVWLGEVWCGMAGMVRHVPFRQGMSG